MEQSNPNLDESVLVGDGGKSWFRAQQQNQQRQRQPRRNGRCTNDHHNNNSNTTASTQLQQEQNKLLNKQQRNRLKRQKKKNRLHNDAPSAVNAAADNGNVDHGSRVRSDFLYTRHPQHSHPFTNHSQPVRHPPHHNDQQQQQQQQQHHSLATTNYVRSSNQEKLNQISAQMFKAKLVNDIDKYQTLEAQLNALREKSIIIEHRYEPSSATDGESHSNHAPNKNSTTAVDTNDTAPALDANGRQIDLITDSKIAKQLHDLQHPNKHSNNADIQTMLREERNQTAADQHLSLMQDKHVQKLCRLSSTDDQFDAMDAHTLTTTTATDTTATSARKRKRELEREETQKSWKRTRLIAQHKSSTNWLQSCMYCVENSELHSRQLAHTVLYRGQYLYIAVPKSECLVPHEFIIVPRVHIKSFREGILNATNIGASADEQRSFEHELYCVQKVLCKLFKSEFECGVVFMETVRNLNKNYHAMIHAYPLSFEHYNLCPTYFQKSILESDVMWNSNQPLVSITKDKPLQRAIPPFMPYFYVQFGLHDGYVHVIEDENKVKQDFGAQIIAGIVEKVLFKLKHEPFQKQMERAETLKAVFEPVYKNKLDDKLNNNNK